MKLLKKLSFCALALVLLAAMILTPVSACTMIYVGGDLTEDGDAYFARSEDIMNSYNKVFYVSAAGKHKAGEVYEGCYGFTYTFTHDSYSYTAFQDDALGEECPDCGGTHEHTPYESAGTNSEGLSVTATVTLRGQNAIRKADPCTDEGIEEAEITTVLLSEAATAKEAVALLTEIYDTKGAAGGSGVIIADQKEIWYVENYSGTTYIAVKLSDNMVFVSPNVGVIGLIDLDDTENVIASANLIEVTKNAGTYVGDEDANTIDIQQSYSGGSANARMVAGINYVTGGDLTSETITAQNYVISNVAEDGSITSLYSNIQMDGTMTVEEMIDFYKVDGIGNTNNLEYHIFEIGSEGAAETAIVEWVGMDHGAYGVSVPYYPMLTTETYAGYQVGAMPYTTFVTELPEAATGYYPYTDRNGNPGYKVLPEGWEDSYYWCFDAVSNFITYGECSEEMEALIVNNYAALQEEIYAQWAALDVSGKSTEEAQKAATENSMAMAEKAHKLALTLYKYAMADNATSYICYAGELTAPVGYTVAKLSDTSAELINDETGAGILVPVTSLEDVAKTAWYADAVTYTVENGIFAGMGDGIFAPNTSMTRAMFAAVLYRIAGSPETEDSEIVFTDVAADTWYAAAVDWANENGIIYGVTETTFAPNAVITREQMVAMLYRYAEYAEMDLTEEANLSSFSDCDDISYYAVHATAWAVANGIIHGYPDGTVGPKNTATRAEVAQMLMGFLNGTN